MLRNSYQSGLVSILYSLGSKPLELWETNLNEGMLENVSDEDVQSSVLELIGSDITSNYIFCPADTSKELGIKLPHFNMIIKPFVGFDFSFEIQATDNLNIHRRFRISTFQKKTKITNQLCLLPLSLTEGWNKISINLADVMKKTYSSTYTETSRVFIHANCRIRRIYFSDKIFTDEELPHEFKLFQPIKK